MRLNVNIDPGSSYSVHYSLLFERKIFILHDHILHEKLLFEVYVDAVQRLK